MPEALVRKRCFVQMTGYEPVGAEHQHRRFVREMARFQKAWNVQGKVSQPSVSSDGAVASWTIEAWAANWRVRTDFHYFRWDDFVVADDDLGNLSLDLRVGRAKLLGADFHRFGERGGHRRGSFH